MKPVYATIIIGVLILISGCSTRQLVTNGIARKIVGVLDSRYEKNLKSEPAKNVAAAQYCVSTSAQVAAAIKTTAPMLNGYKTSVRGNKAGEEIATQIGALQTNLKYCAYVRCKNISGVDVSAARNLAKALGMNAGDEPSNDACKKYEELSSEINKAISK
jgi:hypothetical protein